jgi:hypothetical protein
MAIATLSKFTVPLASDASASAQGMLMPKLKYRFRVMFENFGVSTPTTELTKQVQSAAIPNVAFANQIIEIYNSKINYAGKATWSPIAVVLRDDVTGAVSKLVGEQLQKQFDFFEQSSASSGIDYKFTTKIEILDGSNGGNYQGDQSVLEQFTLYGCYLKQAQYQGADYSSSEAMDITLSIAYDNALQSGRGGARVGIGSEVARTIRTLATG